MASFRLNKPVGKIIDNYVKIIFLKDSCDVTKPSKCGGEVVDSSMQVGEEGECVWGEK